MIDTGILIRVPNRDDPLHDIVRGSVRSLKDRGDQTVTTLQNISEFWNVCTRPVTARGGLGLTFEQAEKRLRLIERLFVVLPEPPGQYQRWRELVLSERVLGARVHDAKLVASMDLHGIQDILTLNAADFVRYKSITVATPQSFLTP